MPTSLNTSPRKKQKRAADKRFAIAEAAIDIIAKDGISELTHRMVARRADIPLAATTYHYEKKADIIKAAFDLTLSRYIHALTRVQRRVTRTQSTRTDYQKLLIRLIGNVANRERFRACCWAEIMLDAPRHQESLALAQAWFSHLDEIWASIARACGMEQPAKAARATIDLAIGLMLLTLALELSEEQLNAILCGKANLMDFKDNAHNRMPTGSTEQKSTKAQATREKILHAAIEILISDGPNAVGHRSLAEKSGLTQGAPYYHFPAIADLLSSAQQRLFTYSKNRLKKGIDSQSDAISSLEDLVDHTTAIFLREATEFAGENVANYSMWLQAFRQPFLRTMIWESITDQHAAWNKALAQLTTSEQRPQDTLLIQCVFLGKLVRILTTNSRIEDLSQVRREFLFAFQGIINRHFLL